MIARIAAGGAAAVLAQCASAQTNARLVFEFDRTTATPASPGVTLTVSAAWDQPMPGDYAFGGVDYDLVSTSGMFTDASLLLGANPPSHPGVPSGGRINGAAIGQLTICTIIACPSVDNPIALAEYTWTTTDFTPRTVSFESEGTTRFVVAPSVGGPTLNLYPDFTPGAGSIRVVPAPGIALPLLALTLRRARAPRRPARAAARAQAGS